MLVLYFTGVILNQLCSLPFFLKGAIHAEDFPTAWFLWGGDRKQAVGVAKEVGWGPEAEGEESGSTLKVRGRK